MAKAKVFNFTDVQATSKRPDNPSNGNIDGFFEELEGLETQRKKAASHAVATLVANRTSVGSPSSLNGHLAEARKQAALQKAKKQAALTLAQKQAIELKAPSVDDYNHEVVASMLQAAFEPNEVRYAGQTFSSQGLITHYDIYKNGIKLCRANHNFYGMTVTQGHTTWLFEVCPLRTDK